MATTEEAERALTTVLSALGYRRAPQGAPTHDVVARDGTVVFTGITDEVWHWIRGLKGLPIYEVQPGQVRVGLGPYGSHSPTILVGEAVKRRNGVVYWIYRRDNGDKHWRRVKAYGAARIARTWPAVESEGHDIPA